MIRPDQSPWKVSSPNECVILDENGFTVAKTDVEETRPYDEYYEWHASNAELIAKAPYLEQRVADLESILQDLVFGADMMLQPGITLTPAMRRYIQEVRRVAGQYKEAA